MLKDITKLAELITNELLCKGLAVAPNPKHDGDYAEKVEANVAAVLKANILNVYLNPTE